MLTWAIAVLVIGIIIFCVGVVIWMVAKLAIDTARFRDNVKRVIESRTCPFCKSEIPKKATVCRYCQRNVEPYEEPTPEEIIKRREQRERLITDSIEAFKVSRPEFEFKLDKNNQTIKVSTGFQYKYELDKVRDEFIVALKKSGIDAKPSILDKQIISTIGIWENAFERALLDSSADASKTDLEQSPKLEVRFEGDYYNRFSELECSCSGAGG